MQTHYVGGEMALVYVWFSNLSFKRNSKNEGTDGVASVL